MTDNGKGEGADATQRAGLPKVIGWACGITGVAIAGWVAIVILCGISDRNELEKFGMFGDSMAFAAVLAASAALVVSASALYLQQRELKQQLHEWRKSAEAQQTSAEATKTLAGVQAADSRARKIELMMNKCNYVRHSVYSNRQRLDADIKAAADRILQLQINRRAQSTECDEAKSWRVGAERAKKVVDEWWDGDADKLRDIEIQLTTALFDPDSEVELNDVAIELEGILHAWEKLIRTVTLTSPES